MTTETWTAHQITTKGKLTHYGICGEKGRIVDVHLAVPNYTPQQQVKHAKLIAAAPVLLDTLKKVYACLDDERSGTAYHVAGNVLRKLEL